MATGPILVNNENNQQQTEADAPSISSDPQYPTESANQTTSRRHSMGFRSIRQSSSSEEDESSDFSAEIHDIRNRRYSVDLHQTRSKTGKVNYSTVVKNSTSLLKYRQSSSDNLNSISRSNSYCLDSRFASPLARKNQSSRPNSPSTLARHMAVVSKRRLASIRRESDCSLENLVNNEFAHEKLVKNAQRVSSGFEDFCLDDKQKDERRQAKSLAEPISVFTNAFLPRSSSPSPKNVDNQKQCYSPSTNQIVRGNIPYSSPSPTPSSPSRTRIMRSMSPIAVRQISKRRFTATGSGIESDTENSMRSDQSRLLNFGFSQLGSSNKRQCLILQRGAASPLVRDSISLLSTSGLDGQTTDMLENYPSLSPASVSSNSSSIYSNNFSRPKLNADIASVQSDAQSSAVDDIAALGELPDQVFFNTNNENSSTTLSSRAPTPIDEQMNEEVESPVVIASQHSPMRQVGYSSGFGVFGRDSSLPPPSPLASKSLSINDCN